MIQRRLHWDTNLPPISGCCHSHDIQFVALVAFAFGRAGHIKQVASQTFAPLRSREREKEKGKSVPSLVKAAHAPLTQDRSRQYCCGLRFRSPQAAIRGNEVTQQFLSMTLYPARSAITVAFALLIALGGFPSATAQDGTDGLPQLHVIPQLDALSCHLTGLPNDSGGDWVLQSSAGLTSWEDLVFFDKNGEAIAAIPSGGQERQFFRAHHLKTDDLILREFLAARNTWRSAGIDSYSMEVSWGVSRFFWHGTVTVLGHEIISAVPINTNFSEPPAQRTIDGWFAHLESYVDPRADQVNVTYDAVFGFTKSAFIDIVFMIADEEQSWSIFDFKPLP